jgi:S1-C subfamily serine protease
MGMKFLAALFTAALVLPAWAGEKITAVTVDGVAYAQIQDAHASSDGRVALIYPSGGVTVPGDKLPKAFLDSWGITPEQLAKAKAASTRQAASDLEQAIRGGYFRRVNGVVYDLRKAQSGWVEFSNAKILQMGGDGALLNTTPGKPEPAIVFIHNLPPIYADNQIISTFAKFTGNFSVQDRTGFEHTIRAYDAGHACKRAEIPEAMLKEGLAFVTVGGDTERDVPVIIMPDHGRPRAIGSGFFVTKNGYLLTNHHVVKDAHKVEVKYGDQVLPAEVVSEDKGHDLAVLKVKGDNFPALPISRKDAAELGQEVFTIGFPNIQLQGVEPKYTDGKISSLAGIQDDPSQYQISVPVQPGNSGGPLCDANGEVVGIVVARLNDLAVLETSGMVPQNVNYAIKSRLALRLLQKLKDCNLPPASGLKPANPVKTVENGIAMIVIY